MSKNGTFIFIITFRLAIFIRFQVKTFGIAKIHNIIHITWEINLQKMLNQNEN